MSLSDFPPSCSHDHRIRASTQNLNSMCVRCGEIFPALTSSSEDHTLDDETLSSEDDPHTSDDEFIVDDKNYTKECYQLLLQINEKLKDK